jgi:hypothetical protein
MGNLAERREAMLGVVGLWKNRADLEDSQSFVRNLRNDDRLKRLELDRSASE